MVEQETASELIARRGRAILGGKGVSLGISDLFYVASVGYSVEIDSSAITVPDATHFSSDARFLRSGEGEYLSREQSRAVATSALIQLVNNPFPAASSSAKDTKSKGSKTDGFHAAIVHHLAAVINHGFNNIQIALPNESLSDSSVEKSIAALLIENLLTEADTREKSGDDLKEVLVSQAEQSIGAAGTVGLAAIVVHEAQCLSAIADSVAALSCEAMAANIKSFDSESAGIGTIHKSQADVASDLKSLLAGSNCVNPRAKKDSAELAAITAVPLCHGSVRETCKLASSSLRTQINGADVDKSAADVAVPRGGGSEISVLSHVTALLNSLLPLLARSRDRVAAMAATVREKVIASQSQAESWWAQLDTALENTHESVEAVKKACVDVALAMADAAINMSARVAGVRAGVEAGTALALIRMVLALEAELALHLIAHREAELASKLSGGKSQEREGKKGAGKKGGGGIQLGKGTLLLRTFLESQVGPPASTLLAEVDRLAAAMDPRSSEVQELLSSLKAAIESNETRRVPKIPKGTRDFLPEQMAVREKAFAVISSAFKRHGGVEIDTPVFELRETLMGKYGEDSKLIYDLADQGGEVLSLRYDLTVPFARYLAMHPLGNIKRYHMAKVYRRDNPQMKRGRFREFYQCDFDIAGTYPPMIPDSEVLKVLTEILDTLNIGEYEIKVNHRGLLDGMLDICGVPPAKFRPICSAIDKLDKEPWEAVRAEMIEEKGLPASVADRIGAFVVQRGPPLTLLPSLLAPDGPFAGHAPSQAALSELSLLFAYLDALGALHRVVLDLSLARGLDYYTGMIFEAVFQGEVQVGSIAAGGRYDHLVGMFSGKTVPSVGMSLGVERVFTIMMEQRQAAGQAMRATATQVMVASIGPGLLTKRMEIAALLWAVGISAEFLFALSPNMQKQLEYANKGGIPWMIIFGSDELEKGSVKVKDLVNRSEVDVPMAQVASVLKEKLLAEVAGVELLSLPTPTQSAIKEQEKQEIVVDTLEK